jgi:hypothetical protein
MACVWAVAGAGRGVMSGAGRRIRMVEGEGRGDCGGGWGSEEGRVMKWGIYNKLSLFMDAHESRSDV